MRWTLARTGLALEALALAVCLLPPLGRRLHNRRRRAAVMLGWVLGAAALSVFALLDHDITLLAGQALACALFFCLAQNCGGGHA